ncbi:UNVERIFIED_CONTAM: hypothetical protein FKN15_005065 [Acipenser sinensis]
MVGARVGAPKDPEIEMAMDFKDLIAKLNQNTAAQVEQCRKRRQELGLPEPTELDLLLQKWEVVLPSRDPRGEEPPLAEPRGEEPPLAEPRGEEPSLAEPRGEKPPLPEPPVEVKGGDVPPPLQASPALPWEVPCPGSVDTRSECPDLPPLDLAPRSQNSQEQSPAWSLAPLPLESQTLLCRRKTSLRKRQTSLVLPLPVAPFPLPTAPLLLESQTSLRQSTATRLCLPVRAPGHLPTLWLPWTSLLGPSSPILGPSLETNPPSSPPVEEGDN